MSTNSEKDVAKIGQSLEKLLNAASSTMPASDLEHLRNQIVGDLEGLSDRVGELEKVPMLREVSRSATDDDHVRTVVLDMRDGSTRTFQTEVDWLDAAPILNGSGSKDLAKAEAARDRAKESLREARKTIRELEKVVAGAAASPEMVALQKQLSEAQGEVAHYLPLYEDASKRAKAAEREASATAKKLEKVTDLARKRAEEIKEARAELKDERDRYQLTFDEKEQVAGDRDSQLAKIGKELEKAKSEVGRLTTAVGDFEEERTTLLDQAKESASELAESKHALIEQWKRFQVAETGLEETQEKLTAAESATAEANQALELMARSNHAQADVIKGLKSQISELEESLRGTQDALERSYDQVHTLDTDLAELAAEHAEEVADLTTKVQESEAKHAKDRELIKEQAGEDVETIHRKALEAEREEHQGTKNQISELEAERDQARVELWEEVTRSAGIQDRVHELETELEKAQEGQERVAEIEKQITVLESDRDLARAQASKLHEQLIESDKAKAEAEQAKAEAESLLRALREQEADEQRHFEEEVQHTEALLVKRGEELEVLKQAEKQLAEREKELAALFTERDQETRALKELEGLLAEREEELASARAALDHVSEESELALERLTAIRSAAAMELPEARSS